MLVGVEGAFELVVMVWVTWVEVEVVPPYRSASCSCGPYAYPGVDHDRTSFRNASRDLWHAPEVSCNAYSDR